MHSPHHKRNLPSEKYTDEIFDWQVKCDVFLVSMATWTIQ